MTIKVKEYMTRRLITLEPDTELLHAVHTLNKHNIAGAPVVDSEGTLVGILTEKDCLKVVYKAAYYSEYGGRVADLMSREVETVSPDDNLVEIAKRFIEGRFHRYPVLDNGRLVGQISRRDALRALADNWQ